MSHWKNRKVGWGIAMTKMMSASRIVDSRWAMTKLVRSERRAAIACWMSTSVRVSTELVASSRMRIDGSARKARAIVSNCFGFGNCETSPYRAGEESVVKPCDDWSDRRSRS